MNIDKEKFGIKPLNFSGLKLKLTQKIILPKSYRKTKKDSTQSLVSSFHQNLYKPKYGNAKFKTSKNSPERLLFEKGENIGSINSGRKKETISKPKINPNNQSEKFFIDNLLEKKIMKIQQKEKKYQQINLHSKTNTTIGFNINNNSIQNNLSYLQRHSQSKNKSNLPSSKGFDPMQMRSNSSIHDSAINNKKKVQKTNILVSSSNQNKIKDEINLLNDGENSVNKNRLIFNHVRQNKLIPVTFLNKQCKKLKVDPKYCSKTSFHTKENTRKNSPHNTNNNEKIKSDEKVVVKNEYININKDNKPTHQDMFSFDANSAKNYYGHMLNQNGKLDSDREAAKKYTHINLESDGRLLSNKNKPSSDKNEIFDNIISKVINKDSKPDEKNSKDKKLNKSKEKIYSEKVKGIIGKEKEKEKEKELAKKEGNNSIDRDLDNEENNNDSFLQYVNNNIDSKANTNSTSNLNSSFESNYSIQSEAAKFYSLNKDVELIISYLQKYYQKNRDYPKTKINFYKYGRLLGKGAFGKVNLALHVLTGRLVAIKSINKKKIKSERQRAKINLETSIMKKLSKSSYVVRVLENYETQKHICIVMEYICAGDLLSYIKKRSKLNEQLAKFIFKQIMIGLYHIHSNHIVHLDIKLDNILIDLDNKVKICDFGVSKKIKSGDVMTEQCGTPAYMAPEIIRGNGYEGYAVDLWSVGVVLYAMLSGTIPFKGTDISDLNRLIVKGKYKEVEGISKEAAHLIRCLLEVDPKKRITDEEVLNHPWLAGVDVSKKNELNLFTNSERILLAQSNVDYRNIKNKENMVENFSIKNLDSTDEQNQKNVQTKSIILAPFNSSYEDDELLEDDSILYAICDQDNGELKIKNNLIKFQGKTKELNRNYELNNNGEIDNGIIISQDSDNNPEFKSPETKSPFGSPLGSPRNIEIIKSNENYFQEFEKKIDPVIVSKVSDLGFKKNYILKSIKDNEFNYATSSYYLLDKFKDESSFH